MSYARHGGASSSEKSPDAPIRIVSSSPGFGVLHHGRPDRFSFAHDDRAGMPESLIGHGGHMKTPHDNRDAPFPVPIRELMGFADLSTQTGDRHQIEAVGKAASSSLMSLTSRYSHSMLRRGHSREREKARQSWQRRDRTAPLHETGQRHAEANKLRITGSNTAHRDQADFHPRTPWKMKSATATIRLATGMKKRCRIGAPPCRTENRPLGMVRMRQEQNPWMRRWRNMLETKVPH